jgi:hypothetical protein
VVVVLRGEAEGGFKLKIVGQISSVGGVRE